MDDHEILDAYLAGSEEAFAELVRRHANLVYSAALRMLGSSHSCADDVAQKTFALLARKASSLRGRSCLTAWLYSTSCNIARDVLRSERRRQFRETQAAFMQTDLETHASWEDLAPILEPAMLSLSEPDRTAVLLRFFQGKNFRDVAESMGVTEDAAKMRASRALQKLRVFFAARGSAVSAAALGSLLAERAVVAAPASLLPRLLAASSTPASVPVSTLTKWLLMTKLQKGVVVGLAFLLTAALLNQARRQADSSSVAPEKGDAPQPSALSSEPRLAGTVRLGGIQGSPLERALANLREVLGSPWPTRRLPFAAVRQAIEDFGRQRQAALPVLMEHLSRGSLTTKASAAFGLEVLGAEAAAAIPELLRLTKSGALAIINDLLPRVWAAVSPNGEAAAELLQILRKLPPHGSEQIAATISRMIEMNPVLADAHRSELVHLLEHHDRRTRFAAAGILARFPEKTSAAVPVLLEALQISTLRNPPPSQVVEIGTSGMAWQSFADEAARVQALLALGELRQAGKDALPHLQELATLARERQAEELHERTLWAIGRIDPETRKSSPEIDRVVREHDRQWELIEKARSGSATLAELQEGLRTKTAADEAALALSAHPEARSAIPALNQAIDQFGSFEAVETLKTIEPSVLLQRVKERNLHAISDVASALGELGPAIAEAVPHLEAILDEIKPSDPDAPHPYALSEAIQKIKPGHRKVLYTFDDLHEAASALTEAIYRQGKTSSPVYDSYITDFQDHNAVSRGQLLRFVEATRTDPELHRAFIRKLLEKNPELAADLPRRN